MSATFAGQPLTLREVLLSRLAFTAGINYADNGGMDDSAEMRRLYPKPKIVQPRVIQTSLGYEYSVIDGTLRCRDPRTGGDWWDVGDTWPDDIRKIVELLDHPTEEVEDPND